MADIDTMALNYSQEELVYEPFLFDNRKEWASRQSVVPENIYGEYV